ncbi:MAG TPA: replication initiation protein [Anaerovoracaceae bacterium]|nr:replication initiation protein [Anaerovoracaceae bacterium]
MSRPCKKENDAKQNNYVIKRMPPDMAKPELLVYYSILGMVMPNDSVDTLFRIDARNYADEMGIDKDASYRIVKKNALSLYNKSLLTETYDKAGKEIAFEAEHMFKKVKYKKGEGYVEIQLNDVLFEYAKRIKGDGNFTLLRLESIAKLQSSNSIRLYEILKLEYGLANYKKRNYTVTVADLKKALHLQHKYINNASGFVDVVLKPCIKDINENTEIIVRDEHKGCGENRQITFYISIKREQKKEVKQDTTGGVVQDTKKSDRYIWNRLDIKRDDINYRQLLCLIKHTEDAPLCWLDKEHKVQVDYLTSCLDFIEDEYQRPHIITKTELHKKLRQLIKHGMDDFKYVMLFGGELEDFSEEDLSRARNRAESQLDAISYKQQEQKAKKELEAEL